MRIWKKSWPDSIKPLISSCTLSGAFCKHNKAHERSDFSCALFISFKTAKAVSSTVCNAAVFTSSTTLRPPIEKQWIIKCDYALAGVIWFTRPLIGVSRSGDEFKTSSCSQFWLATVQDVLHADWQDVWHSPQPMVCRSFLLPVKIVLMWFIQKHSYPSMNPENNSPCLSVKTPRALRREASLRHGLYFPGFIYR